MVFIEWLDSELACSVATFAPTRGASIRTTRAHGMRIWGLLYRLKVQKAELTRHQEMFSAPHEPLVASSLINFKPLFCSLASLSA